MVAACIAPSAMLTVRSIGAGCARRPHFADPWCYQPSKRLHRPISPGSPAEAVGTKAFRLRARNAYSIRSVVVCKQPLNNHHPRKSAEANQL